MNKEPMKEELAYITDEPVFGIRDTNHCGLWFCVQGLTYGSLQGLSVEEAVKLIEKHGIVNIKNLKGKPCIVETGNGMMIFKDLYK